jgi:hypothetical protein
MLTRRSFAKLLGVFSAAMAASPGGALAASGSSLSGQDISTIQESLLLLVSDWSFRQHPLDNDSLVALYGQKKVARQNAYYLSSDYQDHGKKKHKMEGDRWIETDEPHDEGEHLALQLQTILEHSKIAEKASHLFVFMGKGFASFCGTVLTQGHTTYVPVPRQADRDIFVVATDKPVSTLQDLPRENTIRLVVGHLGREMKPDDRRRYPVRKGKKEDYPPYVPPPRYEPRKGFKFVSEKGREWDGSGIEVRTPALNKDHPSLPEGRSVSDYSDEAYFSYKGVQIAKHHRLSSDFKSTHYNVDFGLDLLPDGLAAVYIRTNEKINAAIYGGDESRYPLWELLGFEVPA